MRLAWTAGAICVGALLFMTLPAMARDSDGRYANSPHREWFKNQHNDKGEWCCDESDGHVFYGDYKLEEDGSVTIHDDGKEFKIPAYMVLKGTNPTGGAVWWFHDTAGGRTSYCFAPGSLT